MKAVMNLTDQTRVILPGQTIGIIGGGQLGRMMALAAKSCGFYIAVLDPVKGSPCGQVSDIEINAAYDDENALNQLAKISDVITFEFENIDADALDTIRNAAFIPQGTDILRITQNRILEKQAIEQSGVSVAPYAVVQTRTEFVEALKRIGYPSVLKTARGGYDGKGQVVIQTIEDAAGADELLAYGPCVLEKFLSFQKEISVIVTRKVNGECQVLPVAENIHQNNILHQTIVPAGISLQAEKRAVKMAVQLAESLQLVGTLAIEMFLISDDEILINELAPRPHNSGHFSIEACETSQFEQHIRAICNWPLGRTTLHTNAIMINVLGQHMDKLMNAIPYHPDWKVHLYGKKEAKVNRKMGHVTVLVKQKEQAIESLAESGVWDSSLQRNNLNREKVEVQND